MQNIVLESVLCIVILDNQVVFYLQPLIYRKCKREPYISLSLSLSFTSSHHTQFMLVYNCRCSLLLYDAMLASIYIFKGEKILKRKIENLNKTLLRHNKVHEFMSGVSFISVFYVVSCSLLIM